MQWAKGRRLQKAPAPIRVACVMRGAARADTADKREGDGAAAATAAVMAAARPCTGVNKTKLPRPLVEWSVGKAR